MNDFYGHDCHVCERMSEYYSRKNKPFTLLPNYGTNIQRCILCRRYFCGGHAAKIATPRAAETAKPEPEEKDGEEERRYKICEINHHTYWRNHGTFTPGSKPVIVAAQKPFKFEEKRLSNGERVCADLEEYKIRREMEGFGDESEGYESSY